MKTKAPHSIDFFVSVRELIRHDLDRLSLEESFIELAKGMMPEGHSLYMVGHKASETAHGYEVRAWTHERTSL